jgi:hypothetical protein
MLITLTDEGCALPDAFPSYNMRSNTQTSCLAASQQPTCTHAQAAAGVPAPAAEGLSCPAGALPSCCRLPHPCAPHATLALAARPLLAPAACRCAALRSGKLRLRSSLLGWTGRTAHLQDKANAKTETHVIILLDHRIQGCGGSHQEGCEACGSGAAHPVGILAQGTVSDNSTGPHLVGDAILVVSGRVRV